MLAGVLGLGTAFVVRHVVLDASTYQNALVRADAYNRVYTDVLTDPQLTEAKEELLGNLGLGSLDPASARIIATNTLRWALPPSTVRLGTEALIDAVVRYLRGDSDRIAVRVDLGSVLSQLDDVTLAEARAAVAVARPLIAATVPQYRAGVAEFMSDVAAGRIPSVVPVASSRLPPARVA